MNARAHMLISGRVQGVFYRDHTRRWASSMGLSGWVRNLPDGRVEVLVEGEKESIVNLAEKLKIGPPLSRVEKIHTEWEDFRGEFADFHITW
jgi:acylphosphatase